MNLHNCNRNRKAKVIVVGLLGLLLLMGTGKWKVITNKLGFGETLTHRIKLREIQLKEIKQYNKENIKNERHRLPKVIGIGIKKCGTHGIISFLNQHPLVRIPEAFEGWFFTRGELPNLDIYRNMMPLTNDRQVTMEKTPVYFAFPPLNTPQLIKSSIPDVKLILIVCDPTTRAFSDFIHERIRHDLYDDPMIKKYKTFEEYVDEYLPKLQHNIEEWQKISSKHSDWREKIVDLVRTDQASTLLSNGIYSAHIKEWQRLFNPSSLKVVDGNRFIDNPGSIIEDLQDFIGIPKVLLREDFVRHPDTGFFCYRQMTAQHKYTKSVGDVKQLKCLGGGKGRTRNGKQKANAETMEKLRTFYRPFNQQFFQDVKEVFNWD